MAAGRPLRELQLDSDPYITMWRADSLVTLASRECTAVAACTAVQGRERRPTVPVGEAWGAC